MTHTDLTSPMDPEIIAALDRRAAEIARGATVRSPIAAMLALGSIPVALGALATDVYGQAPSDVLDVLQFALLLEYLESEFYQRAMNSPGLIPASDIAVFSNIATHEATHVTALITLINARTGTPRSRPAFDFTAKGGVPGFAFAATQYATFKLLAQAFEDTGVRAYKGQLTRLMPDKGALNAALAIHSVEARHAAEVRRLRGGNGWITGNRRDDLPVFSQPIYDGEDNTTHGTVNVAALASGFGGVDSATEAFDEPLTMAQVTSIITPFLA
ncbi:hypothetical protein BH11GEM1_BH11GEM1_30490 [soil metagenome]